MCATCGLTQTVPDSTHAGHYLDLILTTTNDLYKNVRAIPLISTSDHDAVLCQLAWPVKRMACTSKYDYKRANFEAMHAELSAIDWSSFFSTCRSVNDYWNAIHGLLSSLISAYVPTIIPSDRGYKRAVPHGIKKRQNRKMKAWLAWKYNPIVNNKKCFNTATKNLHKYVKNKAAQKELLIVSEYSNNIFKYIRGKLSNDSHIIHELINANGYVISNDAEMCEVLANAFSNNFSAPNTLQNMKSSPSNCSNADKKIEIIVDDLTVYNTLCNTRECAAGPDGIPGIVLRKLASVLTRPLVVLFQQSIFSGRILDPWRTAKVVPLFKGKGHRSDPNAYRPISLTSVVSKALERLVVSQAQSFLDNNHFLSESQHGFRAGRSTTTNLIACDSRIASILNSGNQADLFLLDFARAFDKVNHSIFIHKLSNLGFGSCLL